MRKTLIFITLVIAVTVVSVLSVRLNDVFPEIKLKSVKSFIDGNYYYVRKDVTDSRNAADTLAEIKKRLRILLSYLPIDNRLHSKLESTIFSENPKSHPMSNLTSYTINKGEQVVLCLRDPITQQLHNIDLIMYVALHEAAHISCPEVGHTPLFRSHFQTLLSAAVNAGIINKTNYRINPDNYCGIRIKESLI